MSLEKLPKSAFLAAPPRGNWSSNIECHSFVLLPSRSTALHDSGYRYMEAVACTHDTIICKVGGGSDVFDLSMPNDIWTKNRTPSYMSGWLVDCLPRSGLFRFFTRSLYIKVGCDLSNLSFFPIDPPKEAN